MNYNIYLYLGSARYTLSKNTSIRLCHARHVIVKDILHFTVDGHGMVALRIEYLILSTYLYLLSRRYLLILEAD